MRRHARAVAILLLGVAFTVGGLTGMALEEALGIDWFEFLDPARGGEERLLEGLELSEEQEERVDRILATREERLEEYWKDRLPEIRAITERSYAEIRAVLTPGQRPGFDRRVGELRGRAPEEARER